MAGRNPLLLLTATLLAATLEVALPNPQIEVPGAEGESLQGEAIASPRPTRHETAGGSISSASVIPPLSRRAAGA